MAIQNWNGKLRANEIFAFIYNMIISQQVFADDIAGTKSTLVDMSRVDGTLYGDTKLYYSTDMLPIYDWGMDADGLKLLEAERPENPECQAIYIDVFKQIRLTTDEYMTKRAWSTEDAFSSFTSRMLGWIGDTKRIYEATDFNAYIGTTETTIGKQSQVVDVTTATQGLTGEEKARVEGAEIGRAVADLLVDLEDVSEDYNDYGNTRSLNGDDLLFVWNSKAVSKVEKRDLPTIYHKEIIDKFAQHTLPGKYFGKPITADNVASYTGDNKPFDSTGKYIPGHGVIRARKYQRIKVGNKTYSVYGGKEIPANTVVNATTIGAGLDVYIEDNTILFKVIHKRSVPYMSGFSVSTSFYNGQALNTKNMLTFGHNTLQYLHNYPFVTVREK